MMRSLNKLLIAGLGLALIWSGSALAQSNEEFQGKIGRTLEDSEEWWPEPVTPPEGAPNVLVWLIDDMGFGHASPFGGLTTTPTLERLAENGLRYNNWKIQFTEQRGHGGDVWMEPYVPLRMPQITNIRMDPFERAADESWEYTKWKFERLFVLVPAQAVVGNFLGTFKEFPPRQKPGSFSLDRVLEELQEGQPR
jgi:hypothetical protein